MTPNPGHKLTWAVLLGRWTDFARSAVALPQEGDGALLRRSVAGIIALQAVWFALEHLDELDPGERALGLDRAEVLIDQHEGELAALWAGRAQPEAIRQLVAEARGQLARRRRSPPPQPRG